MNKMRKIVGIHCLFSAENCKIIDEREVDKNLGEVGGLESNQN